MLFVPLLWHGMIPYFYLQASTRVDDFAASRTPLLIYKLSRVYGWWMRSRDHQPGGFSWMHLVHSISPQSPSDYLCSWVFSTQLWRVYTCLSFGAKSGSDSVTSELSWCLLSYLKAFCCFFLFESKVERSDITQITLRSDLYSLK